jgi:undecaprenyl-diphosphatase
MGIEKPLLFFDILLHIGTLASVVVFFGREIWLILLSLIKFNPGKEEVLYQRRLFLMLILGTIPTAIAGVILQKGKDFLFQGVFIPAGMLLFSGIFLWLGERLGAKRDKKEKVGAKDALLIGAMQGVAILPGVSRSGVTISCGLMRGLKRELSFQYSFLLFIPAVLGALFLESREVSSGSTALLPSLVGTLTAFLAGIVALKTLKKVLREKKLTIFSWYCWALGGGLLLWEGVKLIS